MNVRYRILFSIKVQHDYYSDLKSTDIRIVPSPDTMARLQAGQMLYKMVGNLLVILIKVGDDNKPHIEIDREMKLRFYMELMNPSFTTKSNINLDELRNKRFYFNNLSQNGSGSNLYLSSQTAAHNGATAYLVGDMVTAGGNAFECIKTPAVGHATNETDYWFPRGAIRYATRADMLGITPGIRNFTLTTASTVFNIQVSGLDINTGNYDDVVLAAVQTTDTATKDVQVDMRHLKPGRYEVDINGEQTVLYIDAQVVFSSTIGIVDIFAHLPGTDDFALLDNTGKTKEHTYTLRFANRIAQWKYLTTKQGVKNITDNSSTYNFIQQPALPAIAEYFESDKPIPLKQSPVVFELELNAPLSEPPPAPNPNPEDGSMLIRNGDQYVCKIYLNY